MAAMQVLNGEKAKRQHNVIMENRKNLSISGVTDVDSFDEQTVVAATDMGELTVRGTGLHIERINTDTGELIITGNVYALMYTNEGARTGFFGRLFK